MAGGRFARWNGRAVIEVAVLSVLALLGMGMRAGPARAAWSAPQLASPALHATAVSCASTTFCMAVGNRVAVWDGSSWSVQPSDHSPNRLDHVACPAVGTCYGAFERRFWRYQAGQWTALGAPVAISNLSCPRVHFCMITTGGIRETQGAVYTFDGTNWSGPVVPSPGQFLWGVSCTSREFCAVVDGLDRVFDFNGHGWGSGTPVSFYYGSGPTAISCSRPGYCAVVNNYGEITFETAGTWGPELDANDGIGFWALSCAGVRFCAAASGITDFTLGISAGEAFAFDGGQVVSGGPITNPESAVSCVSSHFCMALDDGYDALTGANPGSSYVVWS